MRTHHGSLIVAAALAFPLLASAGLAQDTCDVEVSLDDAGPIPVFAYSLDYAAAGGAFIGSGLRACE